MIDLAYSALADLVAGALVEVGFVASTSELHIDPAAAFTPSGDERRLVKAASLVSVQTGVVRQLLGRGAPRYVVERRCQVELAVAGPDRLLSTNPLAPAIAALALLPTRSPTLGGKAERLVLGDRTDDDLPPNGASCLIDFVIRVRSGDPLGCSA